MKEQRKIDLLEEVAEEITLSMGLRANVVNNKIEVDTIAGVIAFEALFPTVMENFYGWVYEQVCLAEMFKFSRTRVSSRFLFTN